MVFMFSTYGVVKNKKYNYYELDNKSIVCDFLLLEKMDTIQKTFNFKCERKTTENPKKIFFCLFFSPKILLDTNLIKSSYNWKHLDKVFPIDTISHISLEFSSRKNKSLKIPYEFVKADNCNKLSVNHYKEMKSYTINPTRLIEDFNNFTSLYNSRDSLISYENIHRRTILCELDLRKIDYEIFKKNKLIANFIIEFSNGRKLSVEKSISVDWK